MNFQNHSRSTKQVLYGIQGGVGSFSEEALLHYLKEHDKEDSAEISYLYTSEKVLQALDQGDIDYGLFATHNSVGGIVEESIQAMARHKFSIVEDVVIPIEHFLMKRKDVDGKDVTEIMAHAQVFKQCQENLEANFSRLKQTTGEGDMLDTANAAEALANDELPAATAILGSKRLAKLYDLDIVIGGLQDADVNDTHFLLVEKY